MYRFFGYDCCDAGNGCWNFFGDLKVNMLDHEDSIEVLVTIPGVRKEEIEVSVQDEFLHVAVKDAEEDGQAEYLWKEFSTNGLSRDILIGDNVKKDSVAARYENGILSVTVAKEKPVTVPIG